VWSQGEVKRLKEARSEISVLNSTASVQPVMSPSGVTPKLKDLTDDKRVWGVLKELPNLRHPNIVLFMGAYVDPGTHACSTYTSHIIPFTLRCSIHC
jgi:hypothetical protein